MATTLYRGDTSRPVAPELTAGTWLTTDPDVAAWYGCAHRYEVDLGRVLDLTHLGVGGADPDDEEEMEEWQGQVAETLDKAGVDASAVRVWGTDEVYQIVETRALQDAARAAGYDAVRCLQWHADRGEESYEAVLVLRDIEDA